jgi:protein TonB
MVNFYYDEITSDEDLNKKLQLFRTRIAKHVQCPPNSAETFAIVEQMPRFYGCEDMEGDNRAKKECADKIMLDFIYSNLNYPPLAKDNEIEGMAVISFTVTTCGTLTDIKILRDPGGNIGKEALRIMQSMNYLLEVPFVAGKQRGQKVQVRYNIPIRFKIEKTE